MPLSKRRAGAHKSDAPKKRIQGIIELTRRGVGYMPWEGSAQDIEISPDHTNGALNGDTVSVEITDLFPRPKGKVTKVEGRARIEFVCTIKNGVAVPDDVKFNKPIEIIGQQNEGEKVLIRLDSFDGKVARGTVIETIGKAGEHRAEMNAIVLEHGFKTNYPPEVAREAQEIEKNHSQTIANEAKVRRDFRDVTTFTIDPADAKDFDDALSIQELPDGTYEIGIHIADVTHFVRPGTALDKEAINRGTSVYLVDATIPMLPHELSGNVCSLKEGEDRLAFATIVKMNKAGEVLSREFAKTIIRSNKRFTYEEAQAILDTSKSESDSGELAKPSEGVRLGLAARSAPESGFASELLTLRSLARILKKHREKEGAIDFGDNEFRFELAPDGTPIKVVRKERIETNSLIEEFMLLANREVASYVSKLAEKVPERGMVFLYRIHDAPKEDRVEELATFVRAVGYEFGHAKKSKKKYSAKDIAHLLAQIEGKPEEHLIRTATLRSMAKAIYSTKNIGHFGLAFEYYTHFTSPIRRYPDMLAHRILASHLAGNPITRREFGNLEQLCIAATEREAEAVSAERDSIRYKQVEYLSKKIGQEFDAVVSGVVEWGLYVEDEASGSEGLVPVRTIGDDFYNYSQKSYALVGQRSKKKFSLGDRLRVRLVSADLTTRQLEFALV